MSRSLIASEFCSLRIAAEHYLDHSIMLGDEWREHYSLAAQDVLALAHRLEQKDTHESISA